MKLNYCAYYVKGKTEKNIKELLENFENKPHDSQIKIDTLDLCDIFGYIKHLEKENSIYQTMFPNDYKVRKLSINNYWLKHDLEVYKKRLNKADEYVTYLRLKCKYRLNTGHLRKLRNILRGKNNV